MGMKKWMCVPAAGVDSVCGRNSVSVGLEGVFVPWEEHGIDQESELATGQKWNYPPNYKKTNS